MPIIRVKTLEDEGQKEKALTLRDKTISNVHILYTIRVVSSVILI